MKIMKRFFLGTFISLFVLSMNAQTEAGKIYLGGMSNIAFSAMTVKAKSDDATSTLGKQSSISLAPQAGYFVMDGLVAGLGFEVSFDKIKPDGSDYKLTSTSFVVGPFVKYYYGAGNIKPFAQAAVGFGSMVDKISADGDSETDKMGIFGFGFGLGAAMFMTDNVGFEMGIGYSSSSSKDKEDNDDNVREVSSGINVSVGIVITL